MKADVDCFDVVALQQLRVIVISVGNLELLCNLSNERFVNVCDGHDLSVGDTLIVFKMLLTALPRADQSDANGSVF